MTIFKAFEGLENSTLNSSTFYTFQDLYESCEEHQLRTDGSLTSVHCCGVPSLPCP